MRRNVSSSDFANYANINLVHATSLLKDRLAGQFNETHNQKVKNELRSFLFISFALLSIIYISWAKWQNLKIVSGYNFIYNTGFAGGLLMLLALMYLVRKRVHQLKNFGSIEKWYLVHLVGGVTGPFLIVLHSSFAIKSLNSAIALVCMICVVASGSIGRYLYTRTAFRIHAKLQNIGEVESRLLLTVEKYANEKINYNLTQLTLACLGAPKTILLVPFVYLTVRMKASFVYYEVTSQIIKKLKVVATKRQWDAQKYAYVLYHEKLHVKHYILILVDVACCRTMEQFLVKWRLFHLPLVYILLLTGIVHVIAVHIY